MCLSSTNKAFRNIEESRPYLIVSPNYICFVNSRSKLGGESGPCPWRVQQIRFIVLLEVSATCISQVTAVYEISPMRMNIAILNIYYTYFTNSRYSAKSNILDIFHIYSAHIPQNLVSSVIYPQKLPTDLLNKKLLEKEDNILWRLQA